MDTKITLFLAILKKLCKCVYLPPMSIMTLKIEFLKGVGTAKADLLAKELNIRSVEDLLNHFLFAISTKPNFRKYLS